MRSSSESREVFNYQACFKAGWKVAFKTLWTTKFCAIQVASNNQNQRRKFSENLLVKFEKTTLDRGLQLNGNLLIDSLTVAYKAGKSPLQCGSKQIIVLIYNK